MTPRLKQAYEHARSEYSDIHEHVPTLRFLAEGCKHVTEMGVRKGVSTIALLSGRPKKMVSYDKDLCPITEEAGLMARENGTDFIFIQGDTLCVNIEETDLLFIDTLHTYGQLRDELTLHSNKTRKYIVMHDTTSFEHSPQEGVPLDSVGLWDAIVEFLKRNANWKIKTRYTNNNGLTILERI